MLWTALVLGAAGSLHCAGMCGPLVLALPATGRGRFGAVTGRLAYHSGRLLMYGLIGIVFGLLGRSLVVIGLQRWLSLLAGIAMCAGVGATLTGRLGGPVMAWVRTLKSAARNLLARRTLGSAALLGGFNGLLPCGLVYAAAAGAAASGGWAEGFAYMTLFGVGTLPMLLGLAASGRALPTAWRLRLSGLTPFALLLVGGLLILRGLALGIPYVSPNLAGGAGMSCH